MLSDLSPSGSAGQPQAVAWKTTSLTGNLPNGIEAHGDPYGVAFRIGKRGLRYSVR